MKYKILVTGMLIIAICFSVILFEENIKKKEIINNLNSKINNTEKEEVVSNTRSNELENYHNAPYKLDIRSSYGDDEALHPKVLNFKEKWNGYKYWMVFSPYPNTDDAKENPHIKVSNDLVNWTEPEGLKNPIVGKPYNHTPGLIYNSDPHLVYNYDTDTLECYYRYVNDIQDKVILSFIALVCNDGSKYFIRLLYSLIKYSL